MVITGFNDNDNMMLVVEMMVVFMVDFTMNEMAECKTVCGLLSAGNHMCGYVQIYDQKSYFFG